MSDGAAANKKRGAVRQLTKDDDPEAEEEDAPSDGTFKKASDEVLATRRIVKVRRTAGSAQTTGPNPFANLQFTAPAAAPPPPVPVTPPDSTKVVVSSVTTVAEAVTEVDAGSGKVDTTVNQVVKVDEVVNGEVKAEVNGGKEEDVKAAEAPTSFQQVSSTTNAFGSFTGGSGFSFSTPAFNFATGFSFGSGAAGCSFEASASASAPSSSSPAAQVSQAAVSLQEVVTETGEENEKAVFASDAVLYEFVEKSWKERGKGELKVNMAEDRKARLVMRSKGNFKLLLNAGLFPDMKTSRMDNRSVTFACANSAASGKEAGALSTYAVKLREAGAVSEFVELVELHKGVKSSSPAAAAVQAAGVEEGAAAESAAAGASESVEGGQDQSKESV